MALLVVTEFQPKCKAKRFWARTESDRLNSHPYPWNNRVNPFLIPREDREVGDEGVWLLHNGTDSSISAKEALYNEVRVSQFHLNIRVLPIHWTEQGTKSEF